MSEAPVPPSLITVRQAAPLVGAPKHEHHRDVQGGAPRAAVFGVSDGLLTNVSLILGVAGATSSSAGFVRLAGLASMLGGAFSMAAGEYVSMTAQVELIEREVAIEREEHRIHPESEKRELVNVYIERGLDLETAQKVADVLHSNPEMALEIHTQEELGISTTGGGSPRAAALSSFASFGFGAAIPLLPWFFASGNAAILASIIVGSVASLTVGALVAYFTGRSMVKSAIRQLLIGLCAATLTYGIGRVVGVSPQ